MSTELPLFPLGTVLFPGLLMPLRVFEPRYLSLVRDLMTLPDDQTREFGVVAIRDGWQVERGVPGSAGGLIATENPSLHEIGCAAELRQINEEPEGRFSIVVVGRRRFRLVECGQDTTPYPMGTVEWLPEPTGPSTQAHAVAASTLIEFRTYLRALRSQRPDLPDEQLPEDPTVLSHLIAATASLPVHERQQLLAEPDTLSRLRAEHALLRREIAIFGRVRAVPVPLTDLSAPLGPN